MKELLTHMIKAIVDNPDEVQVIATDSGQTSVFELRVAKSDMGKLLGKQGRNINAIRMILGAASAKSKKRSVIIIRED